MRMPKSRQPFFASRLRRLSNYVNCHRSSSDVFGSDDVALANAMLTWPHSTSCKFLRAPSLVFTQLCQLELILCLDEHHADVLAAFLERCGLQLASVRIDATQSLGSSAWSAVVGQLAQRKRLTHIWLRQRRFPVAPGKATAAAVLSRGLGLAEATLRSKEGNLSSSGRNSDDYFRRLLSLEAHSLLPSTVQRLPLLLGGCSLQSLTLTVVSPRLNDGSVGGGLSPQFDFSAVLPALAQIRSLRELRIKFHGNGSFTAEAFLALQPLVNLNLLSLAPATDRAATDDGDLLLMDGISLSEMPRWKAAGLGRLTVLELLPCTYSGSAVLACVSAACPQLEELVIDCSTLWTAAILDGQVIMNLPRLRRLRFVERVIDDRARKEYVRPIDELKTSTLTIISPDIPKPLFSALFFSDKNVTRNDTRMADTYLNTGCGSQERTKSARL
jgi:hypothetical protein